MSSLQALINDLVSHAQSIGGIEIAQSGQPVSIPDTGISAAVWFKNADPVPDLSGLNKTTVDVVFNVRLYSSLMQQPYENIDPAIMDATSTLCAAYSGAFTLGGDVMNVDLLGAWGPSMSADAGYMTQDNVTYRVVTIVLPLIMADFWSQVA